MRRLFLMLPLALALSGCGLSPFRTAAPLAPPEPPELLEPEWRAIASAEDQERLKRLPDTWRKALGAVPRRLAEREGELLAPQAARQHPLTPPGSYHCRLVRVGTGKGSAVRSFPDFFCYVRADEDGRLSFSKQTGSELPAGWLHKDDERRMILTGARQRAPGDNSLPYGSEPDRDLVGIVERIGPFRWRLVLPWRGEQPGLDVYELIPVAVEQQAPEPSP